MSNFSFFIYVTSLLTLHLVISFSSSTSSSSPSPFSTSSTPTQLPMSHLTPSSPPFLHFPPLASTRLLPLTHLVVAQESGAPRVGTCWAWLVGGGIVACVIAAQGPASPIEGHTLGDLLGGHSSVDPVVDGEVLGEGDGVGWRRICACVAGCRIGAVARG